MEMLLKQSTLVLLTVTVAALVVTCQEPVVLNEIQKKTYVVSGSSLTLICDLKAMGERYRVSWYFNPAGASFNNSHNISSRFFNNSTKNERSHVLENVSYNSGWYFCEITIEIPDHDTFVSNGTQVIIVPHPEGHPSVNMWMWILLGVSAFTLIVLLIICVWLRRTCRRSREDPIYANTRPVANKQPSPRPGASVNSLKTAASSENLRTPGTAKRYEEGKRRPKH